MDDEDAAKASAQVVAALNDYCTTSISDLLSRHTAKGEAEGEPEPEHLQKKLLALFRAAAELVPAFRDMLAEAGVSKDEIVTVSDIRKKVPLMDKEYLKKYSLPQRCIGGAICVGKHVYKRIMNVQTKKRVIHVQTRIHINMHV